MKPLCIREARSAKICAGLLRLVFGLLTCRTGLIASAQPYTFLYTFYGGYGAIPNSLVLRDDTLYGSARQGGVETLNPWGWGTLFSMKKDGADCKVLHFFSASSDGAEPYGLVEADGVLYGVTLYDPNYYWYNPKFRTVFRISTNGTDFRVLHRFTNDTYCAGISRLLLVGTNLLGTEWSTCLTGATEGPGYGSLFSMGLDGSGFRVLKHFTLAEGPPGGALATSGDALYGVQGVSSCQTLFKINGDGSGYSPLPFPGGCSHVMDLVWSGSRLYGAYGDSASGSVFSMDADGSDIRYLHHFADGGPPSGILAVGRTIFGLQGGKVFVVGDDGSGYLALGTVPAFSLFHATDNLLFSNDRLYGVGYGEWDGVVFSLASPLLTFSSLTYLQSQTAEVGGSAGLAVKASGLPPLSYEWFFNATNSTGKAPETLLLTNLLASQAGTYTVVVTNPYGALTSSPVQLSVVPPVSRERVVGLSLAGQPAAQLQVEYADKWGPSQSWLPLMNVIMTNVAVDIFDLRTPLVQQRFYRARPATPRAGGAVDIWQLNAVTLTGKVGETVRLDCIERIGPVDAWQPLVTVTLTNTAQVYLDTLRTGPRDRLYRIVHLP